MWRRWIGRWWWEFTLRNSLAARIHYAIQFRKWDRVTSAPIIIYQMGKVGSTTVLTSLEALKLGRLLFHIHYLSSEMLSFLIARNRSIGRKAQPPHIWRGLYINRRLKQEGEPKLWDVITPVREPVARNVSAFFEDLPLFVPEDSNDVTANKVELDKLTEMFLETYKHEIPLEWLDIEMKQVFGIDVYSHTFPRERGYDIFELNGVRILLLRLENLPGSAKAMMHEFLGIEDFQVLNARVGTSAEYKNSYKSFISQVHLPPSYLDKMYQSKYARHFYSEEELAAFRDRWSQ